MQWEWNEAAEERSDVHLHMQNCKFARWLLNPIHLSCVFVAKIEAQPHNVHDKTEIK